MVGCVVGVDNAGCVGVELVRVVLGGGVEGVLVGEGNTCTSEVAVITSDSLDVS